jgi:PAS domain S-box-containing protein
VKLRECKAHRLELETKIDELRTSREELEASRNKYALLYDFAPVGYFTYDRRGVVQSVNQFGVRLLGVEQSDLIQQDFTRFVAPDDQGLFARFLETVFSGRGKETCRLRLSTRLPSTSGSRRWWPSPGRSVSPCWWTSPRRRWPSRRSPRASTTWPRPSP